MTTTAWVIVFLVGLCTLALVRELSAPGMSKPLIAVSRYGAAVFIGAAVIAAGVAAWFLLPAWRSTIGSLGLLAALGWCWCARRFRWLKRTTVRSRWPSVARSAGLARLDRRGESWPFDATTTVTGATRVEWLPRIDHARAVTSGCRFRLTPSRGGSVGDVAQVAEQLAAGLKVQRLEVTRVSPSRGEVLVVYR